MINFRIASHTQRPGDVVEIWQGQTMVGAIYSLETGVRIVSKYFNRELCFGLEGGDAATEPGRPGAPGVVEVHFDPKKAGGRS